MYVVARYKPGAVLKEEKVQENVKVGTFKQKLHCGPLTNQAVGPVGTEGNYVSPAAMTGTLLPGGPPGTGPTGSPIGGIPSGSSAGVVPTGAQAVTGPTVGPAGAGSTGASATSGLAGIEPVKTPTSQPNTGIPTASQSTCRSF